MRGSALLSFVDSGSFHFLDLPKFDKVLRSCKGGMCIQWPRRSTFGIGIHDLSEFSCIQNLSFVRK